MRAALDPRTLALMSATSGGPHVRRPRRASAVAVVVTAVAVLLIMVPGAARAAIAGDLDPTFSNDGKAVLSPVNAVPGGVLVQPDGRIVLAGSTAREEAGVWRLNADGTPDRSFDADGAAVADFGGGVYASSAALQRDGRILVAGVGGELARFDGDGSLDETFDPGGPEGDGKKVIQTGVAAVVVQRDGNIALAGAHRTTTASDFTITRLRPDGSLDGTDFALADFGGEDHPGAAAAGPDGTIVVVGTSTPAGGSAGVIAVARYASDGSLDKTFAQTGKTTLGPGDATAVLVQPDGRILVVSRSDLGDPFITRLTSDGRRDVTFGDGGTAAGGFAGEPAATEIAAALRPDGTIFVAGSEVYGAALAVGRLSPGGALDTGFGSGGSTSFAFGLASVGAAAALQPDGKLVVAGATLVGIGANLGVARLLGDPPALPDGSEDPGPGKQPPTARCAGRRATIVGSSGRDTLRGTSRADVIAALGGSDRVLARGGNDLVCGGPGNDKLRGGGGRDRLRGQRGRDRLNGGAGRDRCAGDSGRDRAKGCERRSSL